MIALTGIFFVVPVFFYSTLLHGRKVRAEPNHERLITIILVWVVSFIIPCAI